MSLNLKNHRAYELAAELSKLAGESLTAAVIGALEMRLDQVRAKTGRKPASERMLEFANRFAPGIAPGCTSADHASLYGDDGLPR